MGISADLIVFGGEGNNVLDDLDRMSLYDFLPESLLYDMISGLLNM